MSTLFEMFQNCDRNTDNLARMNPEQIADYLLCLAGAVEEGILLQAAPEQISIESDGRVRVREQQVQNLLYAAPEQILTGEAPNKNAAWFTMGLLTYFVIHGRSYYDDSQVRLVDMNELTVKGTSLISAAGVSPNAGDAASLLRLAVSEFSNWVPEKRNNGMRYLIKAIGQYDASVELRYLSQGVVVAVSRFRLSEASFSSPRSTPVQGNDGKTYVLTEDLNIPRRPGLHSYDVNVVPQDSRNTERPQYTRYLVLKLSRNGSPKVSKLMELDRGAQNVFYRIKRETGSKCEFSVVIGEASTKSVISEEIKKRMNIPADPTGGSSLIRVTFTPEAGCDIALYNNEGTARISDNVLHFDL